MQDLFAVVVLHFGAVALASLLPLLLGTVAGGVVLGGACWPSPGPDPQWYNPRGLDAIAALGVTFVRVNCDMRRSVEEIARSLEPIDRAGLVPWIICDYGDEGEQAPTITDAIVNEYRLFCTQMAALPYHHLALGNEPARKMQEPDYARVFCAGAEAIRASDVPHAIVISAEIMDHATGKRRRWSHEKLRTLIPEDLYDACGLHPYRSPKHPTTVGSKYQTREKEWEACQAIVGPHTLLVDEQGWLMASPDLAADYLALELDILEDVGCPIAIIYQVRGPFGVFDDEWQRRPMADALARHFGGT